MEPMLVPREPAEIAPGAHLVPDWLDLPSQLRIVEAARAWARPPSPMHQVRLPNGGQTSVQMVCLGRHWVPYRYTDTAEDVDGAPVDPLPAWLADLGREALAAVGWPVAEAEGYAPDVALVNYYAPDAKLGLHQDKDEKASHPVVSLSVGDSCTFRFGNPATRGRPYRDLELRSGDLVVFGGESRLAYHGVTKVRAGTADPRLAMGPGRLNITLRQTGLSSPHRASA